MIFTFVVSFAVTLAMKSDDPAEVLSSFGEKIFPEKPIKSVGAPEIKTLFDERNNRPFDGVEQVQQVDIPEKKSAEVLPPTERHEKEIGFFATLKRLNDVKPAVEDELRRMPHYVTVDKIPYHMRQAIVSVEDTRFYKHKGYDLIGIARAVLVNVEAGEIQEGGSTITQQTIKNLFLTSDRTFTRKLEELLLSRSMEKNFDKEKILEIYLNSIYFGSNFYGIYDAAQGYFGKEPSELSIAECAMLAGLPNAPSLYSPYVNFHRAKKRQLAVIDAMEKQGIISNREAESARIEEIILAHWHMVAKDGGDSIRNVQLGISNYTNLRIKFSRKFTNSIQFPIESPLAWR